MRKQNLGRYLLGLGVGIMLGVGQTVTIGKSVWWWTSLIGAVGCCIMIVGLELL
jgi:hypothetical protein